MLPLTATDQAAEQNSLTQKQEDAAQKALKKIFLNWFVSLILILCGLAIFYVTVHWALSEKKRTRIGYEYVKLDDGLQAHIDQIYVANKSDAEAGQQAADTAPVSSLTCTTSDCKAERVIDYLNNYYNQNLDSEQTEHILKHLRKASDQEAISFLHGQRFRVKSYFWLTGPEVYFEIMFWSIFGVICSLLYMLSDLHRKSSSNDDTDNPKESFDPSEIPYQIAKIFYAPFTILVIILGYNYVQGSNVQDISTSKGMLVFAFLGGFFSGRLMAFLNRLKDALLPAGDSAASASTTTGNTPPPINGQDQEVVLDLDPAIDAALLTAISQNGLPSAVVTFTNGAGQVVNASPKAQQLPVFSYVAPGITPGTYTINAEWEGSVQTAANPAPQTVNLVARTEVNADQNATPIRITMRLSAH
jgi:hypothetical protein